MKHTSLYIVVLFLILSACVKEDYFGLSPYGNIKNIEISNQASQAVIYPDSLLVDIQFPPGISLESLTLNTLDLSSYAAADYQVGDEIDLSEVTNIVVTAEDGTVSTWKINPVVASATPQLDNSDFNQWYETSGGYYEPGVDAASTIWGTGNPGTQILGLLATTPKELSQGNKAVQMETLDNGPLAAAFGTPISAGSVFTGIFNSDNINPSDPEAAIDFGTPFSGRPVQMQLKYSYTPADENKDKDGNILPDSDQCDIYALLEIRTSSSTARLATAWFRSPDTQSDLLTITIPFTYGPLDPGSPDYMYPEDGGFVSPDSAAFVLPSHITLVATSSWDGANFAGAIGSNLIIDDVEFIYE